ncbi:MAG TPA: hypothetical protein VGF80_01015 [Galbitalea sp.]|jgi:hypothetical protein
MRDLENLDDRRKLLFASTFLAGLSRAPLGSLSKSELDYLAFVALVDAGVVSIDAPAFELAQQLEVTPAKVSTFVYQYRVRTQSPETLLDDLANAIVIVSLPADGNVVLNVEDRYWRETLVSQLKKVGVYTDTSFNRERVTVPADKFAHVLTRVFGERAKGISKKLSAERRHNAGVDILDLLAGLPAATLTAGVTTVGTATVGALLAWAGLH